MKCLIALNSHGQPGVTGKKTGLWLEEFAAFYDVRKDSGAVITPASPKRRAAAQLVKGAQLIVYSGVPHGLTHTLKDKLNTDLLAFLKS